MLKIENLVEETVVHKSFGTGIIRCVDDKYLEVDFLKKNKKSKFVYPSCFNGFLMLKNEEKQKEVQRDLEQWEAESGAAWKEELRHRSEKTMQEIRVRQAAVEEKKLRAAQRAMEHRSAYNGVKRKNFYIINSQFVYLLLLTISTIHSLYLYGNEYFTPIKEQNKRHPYFLGALYFRLFKHYLMFWLTFLCTPFLSFLSI